MNKQADAARAQRVLQPDSPPPRVLGMIGFLDKKELGSRGKYRLRPFFIVLTGRSASDRRTIESVIVAGEC